MPSPDPKPLSLSWPAVAASIGAARHALGHFAARAGADAERSRDVTLAVDEAVTNVVLHAYRHQAEPGTVHVTAENGSGTIDVVVADDGQGMFPRLHSPGLGLGLPLIRCLTDGFDIQERKTGGTELHMAFAMEPLGELEDVR